LKNKKIALEDSLEIIEETQTNMYVFAGYMLHNAYSGNSSDFKEIFDLLIYFHEEDKLSGHDLLEA
jgi:hypothetical protein